MLSNRITYLRKRACMSQAQLANALNITASALGMYEQGRRIPSLETLIRIARLFGVSLDYLITGSEFTGSGTDTQRIPENCPCSTCYWKSYVGL